MSDVFDDFPIVNNGRIIEPDVNCGFEAPYPDMDMASDSNEHGSNFGVNPGLSVNNGDNGPQDGIVGQCNVFNAPNGVMDTCDDNDIYQNVCDAAENNGVGDSTAIVGDDIVVGNSTLDSEIISADEAEVIIDYPDLSTDIDIDPQYRRMVDFYLRYGNKKNRYLRWKNSHCRCFLSSELVYHTYYK